MTPNKAAVHSVEHVLLELSMTYLYINASEVNISKLSVRVLTPDCNEEHFDNCKNVRSALPFFTFNHTMASNRQTEATHRNIDQNIC
jgi:hypothetical protein